MSGRAARATRRENRERVQELMLQAHDALHRDDVAAAHELLHGAAGIDPDVELNIAPLAAHARSDRAFRQLCLAHGVVASYVLATAEPAGDRVRIISGGNAQLCTALDDALRDVS